MEDDVASSTSRFTSAQVAAAQAACNEAHGPVDPATNRADIEVNLTGSWFLCSPPNVFKLTKSIEFDSDGTYHVLKPNAAGGLSREQGIDNEGTWKVQEGSASVEPGPFFPQFETSPRRLKMTVATSGFENWYVAM